MISYEFVKEVLHDDAHPEITPSTFPEVHTFSGEKLPTIGQIQVTLLLNGRQFPCQFHVINNVAYHAVLGRDFLQSNGAIINFSEGTLKLDNTYPLKTTLREENSRALAILTVEETRPVARSNDADKFLSKLPLLLSCFPTQLQEDPSLHPQIPPHSFTDATSCTCQLTNQARTNNRLTRRMQLSR